MSRFQNVRLAIARRIAPVNAPQTHRVACCLQCEVKALALATPDALYDVYRSACDAVFDYESARELDSMRALLEAIRKVGAP